MKNLILQIFLTILAIIGLSLLCKIKISAYILDKTYNRNFILRDDYVQVNETKKLNIIQNNYYIKNGGSESFIIFHPVKNYPDESTDLQKTISSITVTDISNNKLNFTNSNSENGDLIINVKLNNALYFGEAYSINLSYKSYGLGIKSGNLIDLYIPGFDKSYQFQDETSREIINTNVQILKTQGKINFTSPLTNITGDDEFWNLKFSQQQLIGQTAWIEIGTTQYYSFKINQKYSSSSVIPLVDNTFKLIIPGDVQRGSITQRVFYTKFEPRPQSIEKDDNENLFAIFKLPANQEGNILIEGYAELDQSTNIDIKNSGIIKDIPLEIIQNNTSSAKYWESDNSEIINAAKSIVGDKYLNKLNNVYDLVSKTYKYVTDKINYSEVKKFGLNKRQGALATLEGGAAVCMEYSDLFIALMRAEGVPARAAFGTGYSSLDFNTSSTNAINHQWAEVYIPTLHSWIGVDTTWGKDGPTLIGGDLNHFYSHVASVDPENPSTAEISYVGNDYKFYDRDMSVNALSQIPGENSQTEKELLKTYFSKEVTSINSALSSNINIILFFLILLIIIMSLVFSIFRKKVRK